MVFVVPVDPPQREGRAACRVEERGALRVAGPPPEVADLEDHVGVVLKRRREYCALQPPGVAVGVAGEEHAHHPRPGSRLDYSRSISVRRGAPSRGPAGPASWHSNRHSTGRNRADSATAGGTRTLLDLGKRDSSHVADEKLNWSAVGVAHDDVHLTARGLHEPLEGREEHVGAALEP